MSLFMIILLFFWMILVGGFSAIFLHPFLHIISLLCGLALISVLGFINQKIDFRYISYFLWLAREIFYSSLNVVKYIYGNEKYKFVPKMSYIKSKQTTDFNLMLYANSITLTPGTVTIDIDGKTLLVHALDESGIKDLEKGLMDARLCVQNFK